MLDDLALDAECRDLVSQHGPLYLRGTGSAMEAAPSEARLAVFDGQEACLIEHPQRVVLMLALSTDGKPTERCSGYAISACRRLSRPRIAVFGYFERARAWAREAVWHLDLAEYQAKDQVPEQELTHTHDAGNGHRVVLRSDHPNELWYQGRVVERFGPTTFPEVDGERFLEVEGRLVSLATGQRRVVFEPYAVRTVPVGQDDY